MRLNLRHVIAGPVLVALAMASTAIASSFVKVDVPTLDRMSRAVVQARVADLKSAWNDNHSMIFSFVTLEVLDTLRGESPATVVVRVPGGTVDGFTAEMIGAPSFETGEEVVVFIDAWKDGSPMVAGYEQGVSRVLSDAAGNKILAGGVADGRLLVDLAEQLSRAQR